LSVRRPRRLGPPGLHFALLGTLLALSGAPGSGGDAAPGRWPDADAVAERARREWRQRHGSEPGPDELAAAVRAELDERLLLGEALRQGLALRDPVVRRRLARDLRFLGLAEPGESDQQLARHALALGLAEGDAVVRRRLVQHQRARLGAAARRAPVSADELRERFELRRDDLRAPERWSLSHRYAPTGRGEALRLPGAGRGTPEPGRPPAFGEPFLAGHHWDALSRDEIAARLGTDVAGRVARLPPGRWSAPLRSPYGWHRVYVREHHPAAVPPLEAVAPRLEAEIRAERARRAVSHALRELRRRRSAPGSGGFDPPARSGDLPSVGVPPGRATRDVPHETVGSR